MPFVIDDILIAAAIAAAAGGASAAANSVGASNAANAQKDSAAQAMELQREMFRQQQANYQQQREDQAPWMQAGQSSLGELMRQMQAGQFEVPYQRFDGSMLGADPGYQFRLAEGQKALERSASARGMLNSGAALKGLERYAQGFASNEFGNAFNRHQAEYATRQGQSMDRYNRLAGMAGVGQASAQNLGSLGAAHSNQMGNFANNMSGLYGAQGNAEAGAHMATANGIGGAFNTLGGVLGYGFLNGGDGGGMRIPQQSSAGSMVSGSGSRVGWNPYSIGG